MLIGYYRRTEKAELDRAVAGAAAANIVGCRLLSSERLPGREAFGSLAAVLHLRLPIGMRVAAVRSVRRSGVRVVTAYLPNSKRRLAARHGSVRADRRIFVPFGPASRLHEDLGRVLPA